MIKIPSLHKRILLLVRFITVPVESYGTYYFILNISEIEEEEEEEEESSGSIVR